MPSFLPIACLFLFRWQKSLPLSWFGISLQLQNQMNFTPHFLVVNDNINVPDTMSLQELSVTSFEGDFILILLNWCGYCARMNFIYCDDGRMNNSEQREMQCQ